MPLLTINDTFVMQRQRTALQALRWAQAQWAQLERPSDQEAGVTWWLTADREEETDADE